MEKLYIASKNKHKVSEFALLLADLPTEVLALPNDVEECPESAHSFEANAMEKAVFYGNRLDGWVIADDSGLCVPALGGEPGVLSARYAGVHGDDRANNEKLLDKLAGVAEKDRRGQFVCALAVWNEQRRFGMAVRGVIDGIILTKPRGENGFGYDPLFFMPDMGKTLAELSAEEKNRASHRSKAVDAWKAAWRRQFDAEASAHLPRQ